MESRKNRTIQDVETVKFRVVSLCRNLTLLAKSICCQEKSVNLCIQLSYLSEETSSCANENEAVILFFASYSLLSSLSCILAHRHKWRHRHKDVA